MADPPTVTVISTEEIFKRAIFQWKSIRFTYRRFDGTQSEEVERIVFDRGDSVAMLIHDIARQQIVLVEQLRIATIDCGSGWLLEVPAGVIESQASPVETAHREIKEETGAPPSELQWVSSFYLSPGACSERLHLFYAPYANGLDVAEHAGLAAENEDIRVSRVSVDDAMAMSRDGRIADAKTMVALLWLQGHIEHASS